MEPQEINKLKTERIEPQIRELVCRWSLKAGGSNDKVEFMRKQTRWLTRSKEIAEVLRGDGRWKRDRRHIHMRGKSETASEYPASFVIAMLSAIKRQMISDGAIRVGELHYAGVPDEVITPQSSAHGLTRSCWTKDRKKK